YDFQWSGCVMKGAIRSLAVAARLGHANYASYLALLKQHVEIRRESAAALAEEKSICAVGDVAVHRFRIEMIGEVEIAQGKPHRVLLVHFDIFRYPRIEREEGGIPHSVGRAGVALSGVEGRIREAAAQLHHGRDAETFRQLDHPPHQKAVGQ